MIGWAIFAMYLAGLIVTSRKAAVALIANAEAHEAEMAAIRRRPEPDPVSTEDLVMNRTAGVLIGMVWPVVLAGALITGKLPKTDREIRRQVHERDRHVADLERELGMRPSATLPGSLTPVPKGG